LPQDDVIVASTVPVSIEMTRVAELRQRMGVYGKDYLAEKFTPAELADCRSSADPLPRLAARLAAKAATVKAIGADGSHLERTSIEVRRDQAGRCQIHLSGEAARLASVQGTERLCVSLSHEGDLAIAVVVDSEVFNRFGSNVVAVGIDVAMVTDMQRSLDHFGERFLRRVFTPLEQVDCWSDPNAGPHLAARFAAKEATIKALMVEGAQPDWTSMEVRTDPSGTGHEMQLIGAAARLAAEREIACLRLSLGWDDFAAVALVVALSR
jgi:holo-[acyl-carrier protein] synthase